MKFQIQFSGNNLNKFRSFINMCNKVFNKSGIIMTFIKDSKIRVCPDPFNISQKFEPQNCTEESLKLYKYIILLEYLLIPPTENSQKNSTFNFLEIITTNKDDNHKVNPDFENKVLSFRIAREQLKNLSDLLQNDFYYAVKLIIKATGIPEFKQKTEEAKNYRSYLTLYDKEKNSITSGILFKPLKNPYIINDYEDDYEIEDGENKKLGKFLFSDKIKTKVIKKFAAIGLQNFNKLMDLYLYKDEDKRDKTLKSFLYFTYLRNSVYFAKYINNEEKNLNPEEFKNIYKIQVSSELLTKALKNFGISANNPDYISVWTKGIVFKTYYQSRYNFDEINAENPELNSENEDDIKFMIVKAFYILEKNPEILSFEGTNIDDTNEKKKYLMNLIENNVDDKHEELNKSLELNDIDDGVVFRGNNSFMDEDEDEKNNDDDDEEEDISEIINKKKKRKNKKISQKDNGNNESNLDLDENNDDDRNDKIKEKKSNKAKGKKRKK